MNAGISPVVASFFLVTGGLTCAKPITGKYAVSGQSRIIHDDDDPKSKVTGLLRVKRKSVRMQVLSIDESMERNRCGWTVNFAPPLKNKRRQTRESQRNISCGGSFAARFIMTWTRRGGSYRITVKVRGTGITHRDGNLRVSANGSRS